MDKKWIPATWILRPSFSLWPAKKPRALLWLVAHYSIFQTRTTGDLTHADYTTYLQEALSIIYKQPKRSDLVGNCLTVLSWGPTKIAFGDFPTTMAKKNHHELGNGA
jgi:hypothetical protein